MNVIQMMIKSQIQHTQQQHNFLQIRERNEIILINTWKFVGFGGTKPALIPGTTVPLPNDDAEEIMIGC